MSIKNTSAAGWRANTVKVAIQLTAEEDRLCSLVDEFCAHLEKEKGIYISCRIAGGWVRDKLLGSQSNDIDIAIDHMMGYPFAVDFASFLTNLKDIPVDKVTKIESNPGQSKHLETGRATILGTELDFVNLRSEEYAEDSRIPTAIRFGTPLQDALRRDITINALFYNIHARSVEDCTERGLDDLRNGIIRTPLSPKETFEDDPLRVIRCLRFASRFNFEMVEELKQAAANPAIQDAIQLKISRERIGEEMDKMMKGRDPLLSIQLIQDLSLYDSIFTIPSAIKSTFSSAPGPVNQASSAANILHLLLGCESQAKVNLLPLHDTLLSSVDLPGTKPRLFLAAALTPFRGVTYNDSKKKTHLAVEAAIREGTKMGVQNHYLDGIPMLYVAAEILKNPGNWVAHSKAQSERAAIGLLLREKSVHNPHTGSHWTTSLLFSLVQELLPHYDTETGTLNVVESKSIITSYNKFVERIEELNLQSEVEARPILDGNRVIQVLGAAGPGPWTGRVMEQIIEWQLGNAGGTPEDCETWLCAEQAAGNILVQGSGSLSGGHKRAKNTGDSSKTKKVKKDVDH